MVRRAGTVSRSWREGKTRKKQGEACQLRWFERLTSYAATLFRLDAPVVLAGDYNVMPTELDVYKPERWLDDALFRPEVRRALHALTKQGWTDALRSYHPGSAGALRPNCTLTPPNDGFLTRQ
jgi:exonuclease III